MVNKRVIEPTDVQLSNREQAVLAGEAWKTMYERKKQLEADMKAQEEVLHDWAKQEKVFETANTYNLGPVKLKLQTDTKVKTGKDFNEAEFMDAYPECCKVSISVSALRGRMQNDEDAEAIAAHGVKLLTSHKFRVERA